MKKYRVDRIGNSQLSSSFFKRNELVTLTNGQLQSTKINTSSWFQIMGRGRDTGGVEIKRGKQQLKKSNINALFVYEKASNVVSYVDKY